MVGNAIVTLTQFMWSWTTQTDVTCGLLLICLPLQVILISFLRDLSINLGGSCCGYALVTPSVLRRFVGYSTLDVLSEDVIFCYIYK